MYGIYHRPAGGVRLAVEPRLASWDATGSPGQLRLTRFLDHVEDVTRPMLGAQPGPVALELVVGVPPDVSLTTGGRDLDNYLYPVAKRLSTHRFAAIRVR
ncbi:hypothetical protein [Actinocrispum sp. NPDC049592]|uniref:hypothetical protein n=1 Tax=Actinocrispum sp. NPDC049592 TaxID=3154835 RepID=UPI0034349CB7